MTRKTIEIKTKRYSIFVRRIIDEYDNIIVNLEGAIFDKKSKTELFERITNDRLKSTIDFAVIQEDRTIYQFHDSPNDFWADISEIDFIKKLAAEKILRYRIMPMPTPKKSLWAKLTEKFLR